MSDKLIWVPLSSGELSAKEAFQFLRPRLPSLDWGKLIWSKFIIPRISLHSWKVLRGRVLSEDLLQRRGIALASRCVLCGRDGESLPHIFLTCSFAASLWNNRAGLFELGCLPQNLVDLLYYGGVGRSHQLKEIWLICYTTTLWFIWKARNKMRHDNCTIVVDAVRQLIMGHVKTASKLALGCMSNSLTELRVLKKFGLLCRPHRAPRITEVNWHPPLFGWIKVNTDGAWQKTTGKSGYGGIFRDFHGSFLGAFASNLEILNSVDAEVMAVIQAIELAWVRDWEHIWLEVDSIIVLNFLQDPHLVPWRLRVGWGNFLHRISQMNFRSSHIFREGNQVADALANMGLSMSALSWWDEPPHFIWGMY
ncbi:PREDICTED: putative ribonuclease H protein At1g65750-like [Fragaria vesca subsp. vesca]